MKKNKVIVYAIVILLCSKAFFSALNISGIIIYLICLILEIFLLRSKKWKIKHNKRFALWYITSLIICFPAIDYAMSTFSYCLLFITLLFFLVLMSGLAEKNFSDKIIFISVVFSLISIVMVLFEYAFNIKITNYLPAVLIQRTSDIEGLNKSERYTALATAVNVLTYCAEIMICYSIFLLKKTEWKKKIGFIAISMMSVLIIGERSNLIFIPISILSSLFFQSSKKTKNIIKILIIIFGMLGLLYILSPYLMKYRIFSRTIWSIESFGRGKDILNGRYLLYNRAITSWEKNPLFGNGWFSFYQNSTGLLRIGRKVHVHNIVFELLCDTGVIGTIIILLSILSFWYYNLKVLKKSKSEYKNHYMFTFAIQSFFIMDSMLHISFHNANVLTIYFFILVVFEIILVNEKKMKSIVS